MTWLTRPSLADRLSADALPAGLALSTVPGEALIPVAANEKETLLELSSTTLASTGIRSGDRVLVSLNNDGDLAGAFLAFALARLGATATCVDPRGRMRLLAVLRALKPRVWITTPQGALDFLARLYLEFNVDPMELDLELIVVVGEIAPAGAHRRIEDEFESDVADLYCDPFFGAALAARRSGRVSLPDPTTLGLARVAEDEDEKAALGDPIPGLAELVIRPSWCAPLAGTTLRTGQLTGAAGTGLFQHTIGEHILARGRWISLPMLRKALARIDGMVGWRIELSRGDGSLDHVRIVLGFERPSLVENPMWMGRAREAIAAVTPLGFEVDAELAESHEEATRSGRPGRVDDARGHHLGIERTRFSHAQGGAA